MRRLGQRNGKVQEMEVAGEDTVNWRLAYLNQVLALGLRY